MARVNVVMAARNGHHVLHPHGIKVVLGPAHFRSSRAIQKGTKERMYGAYHVLPNVLFPLDSARRRN